MAPGEVEERTLSLIQRCRALGGIPADRIDETEAIARVGEWGVAIENLCEQLYDARVNVPSDIVDEINHLAVAMKLREHYWRRFTPGWRP